MKKLLLLGAVVSLPLLATAQCTTTNATSCVCEDNSQNCILYPDITVSWFALESYANGPDEYSQTGNGANNGRLRVTGSTPNIGHGSFTVRGADDNGMRWFVCGTDTFSIYDPNSTDQYYCPNNEIARQIIFQRVYQKSGSVMTYTDHMAGTMTYHPTHGHNHVDDWATMTLRVEDPNEPDPRNWDIVGNGAKVGFCLMDYGNCSYYADHCKDVNTIYQQGNTLLNNDFPNYGLGGGQYGCSPIEQGISSGWTDIYGEHLDGMWVNIPPGTCNGDYWIVMEADPNNNFVEEDENNNWTAVPFTLTQQDPPGNPTIQVYSDISPYICDGDQITLTATAGSSYTWSTGATTQSITVTAGGNYDVTVTNYCGTGTSSPFNVISNPTPNAPTTVGDSICSGNTAILTASGTDVHWYDDNGFEVGTGNSFTTPTLNSTTTYFAEDQSAVPGVATNVGLLDNSAGGGYFGNDNQYLIFDVMKPLRINSVKVYADGAGDRTIQLLDEGGNLLDFGTYTLIDGEQRINLNYEVLPGVNYELRMNGTVDLYRNNAGVNYPYEKVDTLSIHTSSAGGNYYYFFYDWEVQVGYSNCASPQTATDAYVAPAANITFNNPAIVDVTDAAFMLDATPAGGTFSGTGVTGNMFDPNTAGVGTHTITYTYTDGFGCATVSTFDIEVQTNVGIFGDFDFNNVIDVYPNPSAGQFTFAIDIPGTTDFSFEVLDVVGKVLYGKQLKQISGEYLTDISLNNISQGVYFLNIQISGKTYSKKLVIK